VNFKVQIEFSKDRLEKGSAESVMMRPGFLCVRFYVTEV